MRLALTPTDPQVAHPMATPAALLPDQEGVAVMEQDPPAEMATAGAVGTAVRHHLEAVVVVVEAAAAQAAAEAADLLLLLHPFARSLPLWGTSSN